MAWGTGHVHTQVPVTTVSIGVGHDLGLITHGDRHAWATFSPCMRYRYALARLWDDYYPHGEWWEWEPTRPLLVAACLNPSTATHEVTDPTLAKLCHYAKRDGFGGVLLGNAFALRATDPRELLLAKRRGDDPVGPHNDEVLRRLMKRPLLAKCAAGWGAPKWAALRPRLRAMFASQVGRRWYCWGITKDGYPRHPLYLRNDAALVTIAWATTELKFTS